MRAHQGVCKSRDSATNGFIFQQTMFRIKDPKRTLDFYTRVMGMTCVGSALKCVLSSPCAQPQPVYQAGFNTAPARRAEAPSALGRLLTKLDFEPLEFSLLFLGMVDPASVPEDPKDRVRAPRPPHHRPRPCSRARHAWKHGGVLSAHPMLQVGCCTSVTANPAAAGTAARRRRPRCCGPRGRPATIARDRVCNSHELTCLLGGRVATIQHSV